MTRSIIPVIAFAALLSGCGMYCWTCEAWNPSMRANREAAEAAADDAQCKSYGTQPGMPAYVQCRMNLDNNRAQLRAAVIGGLLRR